MPWKPKDGETVVMYDREQRKRYGSRKSSVYDGWMWPHALRQGRNVRGCFAEVVARAHFESEGYKVLLSAPDFPKNIGYLIFHYRQKRLAMHPAFKRMNELFPNVDLDALAEQARAAKLKKCRSGGGGDPDLFVYRPGIKDRFFVEVKDNDELRCNQHVCFPLIEKYLCPVRLVRIRPRP